MNHKAHSKTVKGIKTSKLAKLESNDCVVRTLASVFGITYNQSHKFCTNDLKRKPRRGVSNYIYHGFLDNGNAISQYKFDKSIEPIHYEPVLISKTKTNIWGDTYQSASYHTLYTKRGKKYSKLTVGAFMKTNPKGTYIMSVRGHTFAIVDGVIVGNYSDARKAKVIVERIWKIS